MESGQSVHITTSDKAPIPSDLTCLKFVLQQILDKLDLLKFGLRPNWTSKGTSIYSWRLPCKYISYTCQPLTTPFHLLSATSLPSCNLSQLMSVMR